MLDIENLLGTGLLWLGGLLRLSLRDGDRCYNLSLIIVLILLMCGSRSRSLRGQHCCNRRLLIVIVLQLIEAIRIRRRLLLRTTRVRTVD